MLILLSPSKTLDYEQDAPAHTPTQPEFQNETQTLVALMQKKKAADIKKLMGVSDKLAELNYERYQSFAPKFTRDNARAALFAFKGDVYDNMDAAHYSRDDLNFAQNHIRILSGLYGLLRPLDLMQPYRLEMGIGLKNTAGSNLYDFWGDKLTEKINQASMGLADGFVLNLASQEYFKAVKAKKLRRPLVNVALKQIKNGDLKTIGLMAKRARGAMADWVVKNRITKQSDLKAFNAQGYAFMPELSDNENMTFIKDMDAE